MVRTDVKQSSPVDFVRFRITSPTHFMALFNEGMALVDDVACYLDGEGKIASQKLPQTARISYSAAAMSLTSELMQTASWLLMHRAVIAGEKTLEELAVDPHRPLLRGRKDEPCYEDLPPGLEDYLKLSEALRLRLLVLDKCLYASPSAGQVAANGPRQVLERLAAREMAAG